MGSDTLRNIVSGRRRGAQASAARVGLTALAGPYAAAVAARNRMFDLGLRRATSMGRPTLSVGNLTAGGTGKTPIVIDLVRRLRALGHCPAVLLRGYAAAGDAASDETLELRRALPGVRVEANPDRLAGAAAVLAASAATSAFVLDDGFQHRRAARDVDLVLIDATCPFGYGYLLPRGLLREPVSGLRRADAVVITRADRVEDATLRDIEREVERITGRPPVARAAHRWNGFVSGDAGDAVEGGATAAAEDIQALRGRRVVGACGLGNPEAFHAMLHEHVAEVAAFVPAADHHAWSAGELRELFRVARREGADVLVTTEKDWVKWRVLLEVEGAGVGGGGAEIQVWRPVLEIAWLDGGGAVERLLREGLGGARG